MSVVEIAERQPRKPWQVTEPGKTERFTEAPGRPGALGIHWSMKMGTRNLTCVVQDGEYKVAQYGQWDGYPSGQGLTALKFLRGMDREAFAEKVKAARFITDQECEALNKTKWQETHPQLLRDHGAGVLSVISNAEPGIALQSDIDFAADSLFCEFCYVIDFDKNTFEIFKGFNETPLADGERFKCLAGKADQAHRSNKYEPVKHVHTFDLAALPTKEEFLGILEPDENEADAG